MASSSGISGGSNGDSNGGNVSLASEATIKQDRNRLIALQVKANRARFVQEQLHRLASLQGGQSPRDTPNDESRHLWRTAAADGVANGAHVANETQADQTGSFADPHTTATGMRENGSLLVPLGRLAFLPAQVKQETQSSPSLYLERGVVDVDSDGAGKSLVQVPASKALHEIDEQRRKLEADVEALRESVLATARTMLLQHLGGGKEAPQVDDKGQALNEEGLPFVDLNEPEAEAGSSKSMSSPVASLTPLARDQKTKEERKSWMTKILDDIESGGDGITETTSIHEEPEEDLSPSAVEEGVDEDHRGKGPVLQRRTSSSDRPMPVKSALKNTSLPTTPLPRFGQSGIRRGFLNLNPSSPAAEHSSDPVDSIKWDEDQMSGSTSSLGSVGERMGRTNKAGTPTKKKSVRIMSPDARDKRAPSVESQLSAPLLSAQRQRSVKMNERDEDTSKEAAEIIELLGTDVMKGHPDFDAIIEGRKLQDKANASAAQRAAEKYVKPREGKLSSGPAIQESVMERATSAKGIQGASIAKGANGKVQSAFKRGFLQGMQPKRAPATGAQIDVRNSAKDTLPEAPRISQGVSALERATKSDDAISNERVNQGLKPSVPHARPSKAFAEKMAARREGRQTKQEETGEEGADSPAKMSKVRFGTDSAGAIDVKIGTAATEATVAPASNADVGIVTSDEERAQGSDDDGEAQSDTSSHDEALRSLGLVIREEELDEDTVDALGYLSDPDNDPDVGFDSDDLVESAPNFASDSADITDEELRREYERTKAAVLRSHGIPLNRAMRGGYGGTFEESEDVDEEDEELAAMEGTDLSLTGADDTSGQSRFRRERLQRAMQGQAAISRELGGHPLAQARNTGPSMLIPSLANVRFPKQQRNDASNVEAALSGQDVELDGESDEEDDQLLDVMRARLAQRDTLRSNEQTKAADDRAPLEQSTNGPPVIRPASETSSANRPTVEEAATSGTNAKASKRPSLFKARMQQN